VGENFRISDFISGKKTERRIYTDLLSMEIVFQPLYMTSPLLMTWEKNGNMLS
jgi:hypothetical protein